MSCYNNISLKYISHRLGHFCTKKTANLRSNPFKFFAITQRDFVTSRKDHVLSTTSKFCLLFLMVSSLAEAALTAQSANSIQGTAPYFTFDKGKHKITTTDDLLWMSFNHDDQMIIYTGANNTSSLDEPIEVPPSISTFTDIFLPVPVDAPFSRDGSQTISLDALVRPPYSYWDDDEGDGKNNDEISAQGNLRLEIRDENGWLIKRTDPFVPCNSDYYRIILTNTYGKLMTKYGVPNSTSFMIKPVTFYIRHKAQPYACWAAPYLLSNGGPANNSNYNGPSNQWDFSKGFFLQDLNTPSRNFPTIASKGNFFTLTMAVSQVSDISYSKQPSDSKLSLIISSASESRNVAKIEILGPSDGATAQQAKFTPTTFTIYANQEQTKVIYTFKINKWFIVKPVENTGTRPIPGIYYSEAEQYCNDLGYRVPGVLELTNANNSYEPIEWNNGLADQPNNYQRIIGGGLLAEWGKMLSTIYTNDVLVTKFWTADFKKDNDQILRYTVGTNTGDIYISQDSNDAQGICVSP